MNDSQQLREQMWDLVYGLLSTDESQALIARIKSDPQAARLYAEVRLQSDLVGYAARVEDSSFVLNVDVDGEKPMPAKREKPAAEIKPQPAASRSRSAPSGGAWLAMAAATALAALLAVGQFWPRADEHKLAAALIVTEIEAPRSMPGGLGNTVAFHTTNLDGEGQTATVDFALRGRGGRELHRQQIKTNDIGRASVAIPGSVLEPGVRLEVLNVDAGAAPAANAEADRASQVAQVAEAKGKFSSAVAADLPVQAEPQMAYVLLEEPLAAGDKAVNASVWNFGAFSGKPAPAETAQQVAQHIPGLAFTDESGAAGRAASDYGVLNGVVQNQAPSAGNPMSFAYQNLEEAARGTQGISPSGSPAAAPQQRGFFRAGQPKGGAGQPRGGAVADGVASGPAAARYQRAGETPDLLVRQRRAELAQTTDGYGTLRGGNAEGRENAAGITNVAPGEPINVEIPAEYAGKALVMAANSRGVTVANSNVTPEQQKASALTRNKAGQASSNNVQFALPPEADGPIEVALLDPTSSPPQLVSRNYVYREPARKLQIDVRDLKERFAPGERVKVTLQVSDEAGRPAADTRLGVRLWNEQLVQQNAEQPLLLADALQANLPGATISQIADGQTAAGQTALSETANNPVPPADVLAKANDGEREKLAELAAKRQDAKDGEAKVAAAPADGAAPVASRADVEPQTEWYFDSAAAASQEPVELASNRAVVQAAHDAAMTQARQQRARTMQTIGGAAIAGGVSLLVLLAILLLLRIAGSARAVVPALAVSFASLLIGLAWVGWLPRGGEQQVATTSGAAPAAAKSVTPSADVTLADHDAATVQPPTVTLAAPENAPPVSGSLGGEMLGRDSARLAVQPPIAEGQRPAEPAAPEAKPAPIARAEQRQAGGAFGGGQIAQGGGGGAAAASGDSRERLALDQTERKLLSRAPADTAKKELKADADKLAAGTAGARVQPAPAPAGPALVPAATAPASPGVGRSLGLAASDNKNETAAAQPDAAKAAPQAPASLYFNPSLLTDAAGSATIEFTMPPVDSQYRLLIDALGQGRIGSRQQLITCQGEAAK
jgi:hypothetical protein